MDKITAKNVLKTLLLYNISKEKDKSVVKELTSEILDTTIDDIQNSLYHDLSVSQRLLIAIYIYLYLFLEHEELDSNKLEKTRNILLLSDTFHSNMLSILSTLDRNKILDTKSPIETIINPSDEVLNFTGNLILSLSSDGRNIEKRIIKNLNSRDYEHPLDSAALRALEGTPAVETLVRKFNEYGLDKLHRINITGSHIKVSNNNFPDIYSALVQVCKVLDLSPIPELYIQTGFINGETFNVDKPIIVLSSGIGFLTYDELLFLLGHEVGHIKSDHILYHQMTDSLPMISRAVGTVTLGLGTLMTKGLEVALLNWYRKSEFTADRAGLLACQNIDAATTLLMKYAGTPTKYYGKLNLSEFRKQAMEFEGLDEDSLNKVAKIASVLMDDHPLVIMRAQELYKWVDSGEYEKVLRGEAGQKDFSYKVQQFCTNCGYEFTEDELFCPECGKKRNL